MPYYLVENFVAGQDERRSPETAPAGTLRLLRNAFVNEGGEIEKRKAFVKHKALTAYGQLAKFKGRISGPFGVPGYPNAVMFRHRHDTLPTGSKFAAGAGTEAVFLTAGDGYEQMTFWVQRSVAALTGFGALFHGGSFSEFASNGYVVERYVTSPLGVLGSDHVVVDFVGGEPVGETVVAGNANRDFQMTLSNKGYLVKRDILYASAVGSPDDMAGIGSGFLNITTQGQPIGGAMALGDYFGQLAVFGARGVQFYSVDPDFAKTQYLRSVAASLFAPRSVTGYGDGDLLFLSRGGVRSLQARDASNFAAVGDVGSPIDRRIKKALRFGDAPTEPIFTPASPEVSIATHFNLASGVVHQETGQYWLCLKDQVYVMSNHPAAKVRAWSVFDLPVADAANVSGINGAIKSTWVADIAAVNETLVFRNFADEIFIYGGETGDEYDASEVEVILPFMDMGKPGENKYFAGVDLVCEGEWAVEFCLHPKADERELDWVMLATINGRTRYNQRVPMQAQGMQIALRLKSTTSAAARLAQVAVFYDPGAQK